MKRLLSVMLVALLTLVVKAQNTSPILFPLSQMTGQQVVGRNLTIVPTQPYISDGTNIYVGLTVITNVSIGDIVIPLTPSCYYANVQGVQARWQFCVPTTLGTNITSVLSLSSTNVPTVNPTNIITAIVWQTIQQMQVNALWLDGYTNCYLGVDSGIMPVTP